MPRLIRRAPSWISVAAPDGDIEKRHDRVCHDEIDYSVVADYNVLAQPDELVHDGAHRLGASVAHQGGKVQAAGKEYRRFGCAARFPVEVANTAHIGIQVASR